MKESIIPSMISMADMLNLWLTVKANLTNHG